MPAAWAVAATVDTPDGRLAIGTGLEPARTDGGLARRVVRIDGRPAQSQTALGQHVAAVWLTPQLDRLFLDGPGERRRFLDRLVTALHPEHAGDVAAYENALRQRARLLADGGRDPPWFAALEDTMARHGVALAAARAERSSASTPPRAWASAPSRGPPSPWRARSTAGSPACRRSTPRTGCAASWPPAACATPRPAPHPRAASQRSRGAPPRSRPAGGRGSTGQQKAVLVSIVLAHARLVALSRGRPPLLLLDEIAAHLDAERREALFDEVVALGVQSWLTGTDAGLFAPLGGRAQFLRVADGSIAAV